MMNSDIQQALGQVFHFTGRVAVAIRLNSAYGREYNRPYRDYDVMHLSDLLHHLVEFGDAVSSGDPEKICVFTDYYLQKIESIKKNLSTEQI